MRLFILETCFTKIKSPLKWDNVHDVKRFGISLANNQTKIAD